MATTASMLWKHSRDESLPEWDADRCFALFMVHTTGKPTEEERDEFARQVMNCIALYFGRLKTMEKLRNVGLDPRHVAQDIAAFIVTRVDRFKLRQPCPKTMIKSFNVAIHHRLADAFNAARPTLSLELTGDVFFAPPSMPDLSELGHLLRRKSCVMSIIRNVPGDLALLVQFVRHQRERILQGTGPAPWTGLPEPLRPITDEQHSLITARLTQVVNIWILNRGSVQQ